MEKQEREEIIRNMDEIDDIWVNKMKRSIELEMNKKKRLMSRK